MKRAAFIVVLCLALLSPAKGLYASDIEHVRARVLAWGKAWQNRDIDHYMSFYSQAFRSKKLDYWGWKEKKAQAFNKAKNLKVEISDLWVFIEREVATASFVQRYHDQSVLDVGEKTLILVLENDTWKIISEEWKPLKIPVQPAKQKTTVQNIALLDSGVKKDSQQDHKVGAKDLPTTMPAQTVQKKTAVRKHGDSEQSTQKASSPDQGAKKYEKNIVKNITFKIKKDSEKVFIEFNRFLIPKVQTLEGDKPRIVVDIMDVAFWEGPSKIPVNGKLIRRIRTYLHHDIGKLRIVLDLNPANNFMIDQTFYKAENIYSLEVK